MTTSSKSSKAFFIVLTVLVLAASWFTPATEHARQEAQGGLQRALTVFAAARALGAVVAVAQGTQVQLSTGVAGVEFAPGQVLQPLDHLIDQFAEVMLVASVSFGIQLLLLNIGTHWIVSALVSLAVVGLLLLRWKGAGSAVRWLQPLLVLLLVIRFAVPLAVLGNEALYRWFVADDLRNELSVIQTTPAVDSDVKASTGPRESGFVARMMEWGKKVSNVKGHEDVLKSAATWSTAIVKLIGYFVVQTILFPIAFLWLTWALARLCVRAALPDAKV